MVKGFGATMAIGEHKFDLTPFTEISHDRVCKMSIHEDWVRAHREKRAIEVADMVRDHGIKKIRNKKGE